MKAISALRVPLNIDLSDFVQHLQRLELPHRVTEEAGVQVIWVPDFETAEKVEALYESYRQAPAQFVPVAVEPTHKSSPKAVLKHSPITLLLLAVTLVVAVLTGLGERLTQVAWLSFNDFSVQGAYAFFVPLAQSLEAGQWWRLITPMFIHFRVLHLAMNSLWIWELGRRVEARQGHLVFILLVFVYALVSNSAQYLYSGPSIFGGLSGVLYALLGHCWVMGKIAPCAAYQLPRGVVTMMLIWLVVCMSGVFDLLGLGAIANAAHLSGLVIGCFTGALLGFYAKTQQKPV